MKQKIGYPYFNTFPAKEKRNFGKSGCTTERYGVYYDRKEEEIFMRKIILASASPRRRELLERAGLSFTVMPASGEEKRSSEDPAEVVLQLARDKASAVADTLAECEEGTLVIGSDTIVVFENRILGKPKDKEDAAQTLEKLQGNTHQVYTGVSVLERKTDSGQTILFMRAQM